jgi:collagenase-like PrtC family protease
MCYSGRCKYENYWGECTKHKAINEPCPHEIDENEKDENLQ